MKKTSKETSNRKTNIFVNFISTLSAVFIAAFAALSLAGGGQPLVTAATNNSVPAVQQVAATTGQTTESCSVPGSGGGSSGNAPTFITSAFHPAAGPMSHFSSSSTANNNSGNTNTDNSVDSHDHTTNVASNNTTHVLSDIANGNTVNVPILNNSVNGNSILNNDPILSNNATNTAVNLLSNIL